MSADEGELTALRSRVAVLENELAEVSQRAVRCDDDRFRVVFDYSNDAIFLSDPTEDLILDCNPRACEMLGYTREELVATPMSAIHPREMDRVRAFADEVFERGHGWTDALTCETRSGKRLAAEISASLAHVDDRVCMIAMVRDVSERARLRKEVRYLAGQVRAEGGFGDIVGDSPELAAVLERVALVADTRASVLVTGESGTGKELIAHAIHDRSDRREAPLVCVNCATVPAELFESEFFGHARGAFTGATQARSGRFELADGGTLFLDEVGEIPLALQSKLLRVLQEGRFERVGESHTRTVDVRVVCATNRDLRAEVAAGRFREDLYYRLEVFPIELPPLRERRGDIAPLAEHLLEASCARLGVARPDLEVADIAALEGYGWPGNVRELQNVMERAAILSRGGPLQLDIGPGGGATEADSKPSSLDELKTLEREIVRRALVAADWKIGGADGAAAALGLAPTTLASRLKKLGLHRP